MRYRHVFSIFFGQKKLNEQQPAFRANYSSSSLWDPAIYQEYRTMVNNLKPTFQQLYFPTTNSANDSDPERVIKKAEAFYAAGEFALRYISEVRDVEKRKLALCNDEILEMYSSASLYYRECILWSPGPLTGEQIYFSKQQMLNQNQQQHLVTIDIFRRFFDISMKSASLALFAEDFIKFEIIIYSINKVYNKLKLSYPEQAIDLMLFYIQTPFSQADDKILTLALHNLLSNDLKDIFYKGIPLNIQVMNAYRKTLLNAMDIARDINQNIEYYNSSDFKNKFTTLIQYNNFYAANINQFDIKNKEILMMQKRLQNLEKQGLITISADGIISYVDNRQPLLYGVINRNPSF